MTDRLGPLEINPLTKEPFLRLRKHPNIIMTPPRPSDVTHVLSPLNDERIHIWLGNVPYPYLTGEGNFDRYSLLHLVEYDEELVEHAQNWIDKIKPQCDLGLEELIDAVQKDEPITLSCSPVRFLREVQENGSEIYIGDIGVTRSTKILLENPGHGDEINLALPAGHQDIIWTFGDWVVPTHHGRGIMTDALDTLINDLAKPFLKARRFTAEVYGGNEASDKVFLKNGFTLVRQIPNYGEFKGLMRDINVYERYDATET